MRRTRALPVVSAIVMLTSASCGGAEPTTTTTLATGAATGGETPPVARPPSGPRPGSTAETAVPRCGPRDSYYYVAAKFKCPDGTNPLGGNIEAGAGTRRGNVGEGPDGHILDVYDVPCAGGPIAVYIDMYHCREGQQP